MRKEDETKYTSINSRHYCDFCGKICKKVIEYEQRYEEEYQTCDCEKSVDYVKLKNEFNEISWELDKVEKSEKHITIREALAEKEIKEIKKKYGVG